MPSSRNLRSSMTSLLLAAAFGCGASGGAAGGATGTMSVHLVDGPADYLEVNVHVLAVEISSGGKWTTIGTPDRTVNLLTLTGGVFETLADGATLPAGHYGQIRLMLGGGNTVKLLDGSVHDLTVPSGARSGLKLVGDFDVQPGTAADVFIDIDARRSIFVHEAGSTGEYILRPVIRAVERSASGTVAGTIRGSELENPLAPLAGVLVTAQALDAAGRASIVRSARTDATGGYALDLLPLGGTYFVVSQPVTATAVYPARASGPIALTAAAPSAAWDLDFRATRSGALAGSITPVAGADAADVVEARAVLVAGSASHAFVIATTNGVVRGRAESYELQSLPSGSCSLSVTRTTTDSSGLRTSATGAAADATVPAGGTATVDLTAP